MSKFWKWLKCIAVCCSILLLMSIVFYVILTVVCISVCALVPFMALTMAVRYFEISNLKGK